LRKNQSREELSSSIIEQAIRRQPISMVKQVANHRHLDVRFQRYPHSFTVIDDFRILSGVNIA
jgi:hypothetical protein